MDNNWLNDPALQTIHPRKKQLLLELYQSLPGCTKKQLLGNIMTFQQKMKAEQLALTPEESRLMLEILKNNCSEAEKERLRKLLRE